MADLTGQSLGRYHILEQLGEGGMATVYKAYDTRLERDVAVKVIRVDQFAPAVLARILKRFEREAKALARLTHPNIVHVNDFGEQDGIPYLVMDYLPGGTLKQRLGMPMPWQEAVKLLLPLAEALDYAHSQGLVHRDVKPSNILLTQRGQPMLTDFGIAKLLESGETQTLTGTGAGVGTPEYMAPEQVDGKNVDARADVYSLGVVLYELITGRKPYMADTPMAVMIMQARDPLPRPGQYVKDLPEAVEKALLKALAKKPEDRYPDMAGLVQVFEELSKDSISEERGKDKRIVRNRQGIELLDDSRDTFNHDVFNAKTSQFVQVDDKLAVKPVTKNNEFTRYFSILGAVVALIAGIITIWIILGKEEALFPLPTTTIPDLPASTQGPSSTSSPIISTMTPTYTAIGGGGRLAFESGGEIYLMNVDGSAKVLLTEGSNPSWSPDGTQLAYIGISETSANQNYFVISVDGSSKVQITNLTAWNDSLTNPSWAPDGSSIVFSYDRFIPPSISTGIDSICKSNTNFLGSLDCFPAMNARWARYYSTAWSPIGDRIAYCATFQEILHTASYSGIYMTNTGGTNATELVNVQCYHLVWSPAGDQIAFSDNGYIYIHTIGDSEFFQITDGRYPSWSPDGRFLAYISDDGGINTINIYTGEVSRINNAGNVVAISWAWENP